MYINRDELEERLIPVMNDLRNDKNKINAVYKKLHKYKVMEGDLISLFNQPDSIRDIDPRLLCLLTRAIQTQVKSQDLIINEIFTESDIKESNKYNGQADIEKVTDILPLTLEGAGQLDSDTFMIKLDIKQINRLLETGILYYDFDTQRESKFKRKGQNIVQVANVNKQSISEISECILNDTLVKTVLTLNATIGTSNIDQELIYDEKKREITITEGTKLAIIDGFHRIKGIQLALAKNPDKELVLPVLLTNYSIEKAKRYLGQIAKANPISKTRAIELSKSRKADDVVQYLKENSELKGRISQTERIHSINNEIVTYNILADTIESQFELKTRLDIMKVGKYLAEFFDILFALNSEAFVDNVTEVKKYSLINDNSMFIGYITIASRMYKESDIVDISKIESFINSIDFSFNNSLWEDLKLLKNGKRNFQLTTARKNILKYFKELEVGGIK